jgi:hypothetical protein
MYAEIGERILKGYNLIYYVIDVTVSKLDPDDISMLMSFKDTTKNY